MKLTLCSCAIFLAGAVTARGAGFQVMDTTIDAAPEQMVGFIGTGLDELQGMDLYAQVRGAPLVIQDIEISGTIWGPNNSGPNVAVYPSEGFPNAQVGIMTVTTGVGTVSLPGAVAVLIVDGTGLAGETVVITANTDYAASDFATIIPDTFVDGTITIRSDAPPQANQPPVVDAGIAQTATSDSVVTLGGYALDAESDPLTYAWNQLSGPAVSLGTPEEIATTFVAPQVDSATELSFEFSVSDGTSTPTDTVTITVNPPPAPDDPPPPDPDDGGTPPDDGGGPVDPSDPTDPAEPPDDGAGPTDPPEDGTDPTDPDDGGTDPTEPDDGGATPVDPGDPDDGGTTPVDPSDPNNGGTDPTQPDGSTDDGTTPDDDGTVTPDDGSDTGGSHPSDDDGADGLEDAPSTTTIGPSCGAGLAEIAMLSCAGWMLVGLMPRRTREDVLGDMS